MEKIAKDLSSPSKLISLTPPGYTEDALDAELKGSFNVDVYINRIGKVLNAELTRKTGYGMDKRVPGAVYQARYPPRTNKAGITIASWTSPGCTLILED